MTNQTTSKIKQPTKQNQIYSPQKTPKQNKQKPKANKKTPQTNKQKNTQNPKPKINKNNPETEMFPDESWERLSQYHSKHYPMYS